MTYLSKQESQKGFTLVELLVVISIISLLTSVITVSLSTARARAQDATAKVEVNQLRTAVTSYKLDHSGKAPVVIGGTSGVVSDSDQTNFSATLAPLVSGGYMPALKKPVGIFYYASSSPTGGDDVVVIGATLKTEVSTLTGGAGSCRPFSNQLGAATIEPTPPGSDLQVGQGWYYWRDSNGNILGSAQTKCHNNFDDDFDGKTDYNGGYNGDMADPGCGSIDDDSESPDPTFATTTPAFCSNNMSNSDYCVCI